MLLKRLTKWNDSVGERDLLPFSLVPVQVINYLSYRRIRMAAHYLHVVKDWAVGFHGLTDAVFERFQRYAQLKAMLHE